MVLLGLVWGAVLTGSFKNDTGMVCDCPGIIGPGSCDRWSTEMARATTPTLLSLDRYAKIMGISPAFFNGGGDIDLASGAVLFPIDNAQNSIWPQYSWQNADQVSREELALEIQTAEQEISDFLGYSPVYKWTESERYYMPRPYKPEYSGYRVALNVGGEDRSLRLKRGYFVSGGRRKSTLVSAALAVVYSDPDADGWNELATVTVAAPAGTASASEIKMYFTGRGGVDAYEIRDFISRTMIGANVVFKVSAWMLIDPSITEELPTNNGDGKGADFTDPLSFVTTVDIYRVINDTTQNHVLFTIADVLGGTPTTFGGMIYRLDDEVVIPIEATYSAVDGWARTDSYWGYADYVDLWYYSGVSEELSNDYALAIAYLATARLERIFYANNNATALASRLREDLAVSPQGMFIRVSNDVLDNPFGTRRGEYEAWKKIRRFKQSRNVGGAL
jgi:hypothetical protein